MRYAVHIDVYGKRWMVRKYLAPRAMRGFLTKLQAINYALKQCKSGDEVSIHNRVGMVDRFLKVF
jgi:hypothetical protein